MREHWNPPSEPRPIVEQQTIHQEELNAEQINHFDVPGIPDIHFGWIDTWYFPGVTKRPLLEEDDWGLRKIINHDLHSNPITALSQNAQKNLESLLHEIDLRNKQFLMLFTPSSSDASRFLPALRGNENYVDMIIENESLLSWVVRQIGSILQLNNQHASNVASALSPFQNRLLGFLTTNLELPELTQVRWRAALRESKMKSFTGPKTSKSSTKTSITSKTSKKPKGSAGSALLTSTNLSKAYITKIAIHALGAYYKLFNSTKLSKLFGTDENFVQLFVRMKGRENDGTAARHKPEEWAKLKILPWKNPDQFDQNSEVFSICKKIRNGGAEWKKQPTVESKFVQVPPSENESF
jgi:hypothetical protein